MAPSPQETWSRHCASLSWVIHRQPGGQGGDRRTANCHPSQPGLPVNHPPPADLVGTQGGWGQFQTLPAQLS